MFDAVIVSGGNIEKDFALDFLRKNKNAYLAAADGGLKFCRENGILPELAVGDFDSVPEELVVFFEQKGTEIIRLCPEKDDSDSQSLMKHLLQRGITSCAMLGCTGTRLDHVFANLELLLYARDHGLELVLYDPNNCISLARSGQILKKREQYGTYVSFFPLGGEVKELTLEGFYYPLRRHTLTVRDCSLTVSNQIIAEKAQITFSEGTLLLMMSKD